MKNIILFKLIFFFMTGVVWSGEIYSIDYRSFKLKYNKNEIYRYVVWDHRLESPTITINATIMNDNDFLDIVRQSKGLHKKEYDYSLDLLYILDRNLQKFILGVKLEGENKSLFYPYNYKHNYISFIKKVIAEEEKKIKNKAK